MPLNYIIVQHFVFVSDLPTTMYFMTSFTKVIHFSPTKLFYGCLIYCFCIELVFNVMNWITVWQENYSLNCWEKVNKWFNMLPQVHGLSSKRLLFTDLLVSLAFCHCQAEFDLPTSSPGEIPSQVSTWPSSLYLLFRYQVNWLELSIAGASFI